jgi:hypothetical protein
VRRSARGCQSPTAGLSPISVSSSRRSDAGATRSTRFVDSALAVAGNPKSGEAYVRVSGSTESLWVEVTHLSFGAHDALEHDEAALIALDDLRQEVCSRGERLTMERGPRGQLRIATVIRAPSADGRDNVERNCGGEG